MEIFLFTPVQQQQQSWFDSIMAIFLPRDMPGAPGGQVPRLHEHIHHQRGTRAAAAR